MSETIGEATREMARLITETIGKLKSNVAKLQILVGNINADTNERIDKLWQHVNGSPGEEWMERIAARVTDNRDRSINTASSLASYAKEIELARLRLNQLEADSMHPTPEKPAPKPCCARCDHRCGSWCRHPEIDARQSLGVKNFAMRDVHRAPGEIFPADDCPLLKATP